MERKRREGRRGRKGEGRGRVGRGQEGYERGHDGKIMSTLLGRYTSLKECPYNSHSAGSLR